MNRQERAQMAMDAQSACNPRALINALAESTKEIDADEEATGLVADQPIIRLLIWQLFRLSFGDPSLHNKNWDGMWQEAYDACEKDVRATPK